MADDGDIRVLLVDDQRLMRDGMRTLLSLEEGIAVAGEASNGLEAVERAEALRPDVILMDIRMPEMNGVEATKRIGLLGIPSRVLILTTFDDDELVFDALREGAKGYLTKDLPSEEIARAIRQVHGGGAVMPPSIALKVIGEFNRVSSTGRLPITPGSTNPGEAVEPLTDREREVLALLGQGYSNREIGDALYITEGTAKNHVSSIIEKLGLRDRTQAALWAVRHGF